MVADYGSLTQVPEQQTQKRAAVVSIFIESSLEAPAPMLHNRPSWQELAGVFL